MANHHHTFNYIELGAPDLPRCKQFYAEVFGWQFNDYGPSYAGIRSQYGDAEVGGLDAATKPSPGGPLVLLYSEGLDTTAEAIRQAGGEITQGPYNFPGGRRFHFRDPVGNELGVWGA